MEMVVDRHLRRWLYVWKDAVNIIDGDRGLSGSDTDHACTYNVIM